MIRFALLILIAVGFAADASAAGITHSFVSTNGDPADASLIGATKWNAEHAVGVTGILKGSAGAIVAATGGTDYLTPSGSGASLTGLTAAQVGLGNVTNESKATLFTAPTFTGKTALGAGTVTTPALEFTSGVIETSVDAGDVEYDGKVLYFTPQGAQRGVIPAQQVVALSSAYTQGSALSINTLTKLFNATTNGQVSVSAATAYLFDCNFSLSALSSTSGSIGFGFILANSASLTSIDYEALVTKGAAGAATPVITHGVAATNTTVSAANVTTTAHGRISGIIRVNAAGTIAPAYSVSVAATPVTGANSFFTFSPIGANTVTTVGQWQ